MKGNDDTVHFLMGSCLSLRCFSGCHSHVAPHAITVTVIYKNQKSRKEEEKRGECKRNNEACFGSLESHFFGVGRMSKAFASRAELLTLLKSKMHAQEKKKRYTHIPASRNLVWSLRMFDACASLKK